MAKRRKGGVCEWEITAHRPLTRERKRLIDSVDVQINVKAKVPKGAHITRKVVEEAIRYRAAHGKNPRGFKLRINRWRNPDRYEGELEEVYKNAESAAFQKGWRDYGPQKDRWATLARALQGTKMEYQIAEHRCPRRKKRSKKSSNRRGSRAKGRRV